MNTLIQSITSVPIYPINPQYSWIPNVLLKTAYQAYSDGWGFSEWLALSAVKDLTRNYSQWLFLTSEITPEKIFEINSLSAPKFWEGFTTLKFIHTQKYISLKSINSPNVPQEQEYFYIESLDDNNSIQLRYKDLYWTVNRAVPYNITLEKKIVDNDPFQQQVFTLYEDPSLNRILIQTKFLDEYNLPRYLYVSELEDQVRACGVEFNDVVINPIWIEVESLNHLVVDDLKSKWFTYYQSSENSIFNKEVYPNQLLNIEKQNFLIDFLPFSKDAQLTTLEDNTSSLNVPVNILGLKNILNSEGNNFFEPNSGFHPTFFDTPLTFKVEMDHQIQNDLRIQIQGRAVPLLDLKRHHTWYESPIVYEFDQIIPLNKGDVLQIDLFNGWQYYQLGASGKVTISYQSGKEKIVYFGDTFVTLASSLTGSNTNGFTPLISSYYDPSPLFLSTGVGFVSSDPGYGPWYENYTPLVEIIL